MLWRVGPRRKKVPNWDLSAWEEERDERMEKLKLKPTKRSPATILLECIEGGIVGGLNKCYKWDLIPRGETENEEEVVRLITSYIMGNVEEEFDLD